MAQWMIMLKLGSLITFIMHQIHSWCLHVSELHCTCDTCSATVPQDQNTLFNYCICSIQLPSFSDCCLKLEEKARKSWPGASFQEQELYVEWTGSGRIRMVRYSSQFCQPRKKHDTYKGEFVIITWFWTNMPLVSSFKDCSQYSANKFIGQVTLK